MAPAAQDWNIRTNRDVAGWRPSRGKNGVGEAPMNGEDYAQTDVLNKWNTPQNPFLLEKGIPDIQPTSNIGKVRYDRAFDTLVAAAQPSDQAAIRMEKWRGTADEVRHKVNQQYEEDFRLWLMKRGRVVDHERAGWWPRGQVKPPKMLQTPGYLSEHESVKRYVEGFLEGQFEFEKTIAKLRLEAEHGAVQDWPLDKLYLYYKFVVRGLNTPTEDDVLIGARIAGTPMRGPAVDSPLSTPASPEDPADWLPSSSTVGSRPTPPPSLALPPEAYVGLRSAPPPSYPQPPPGSSTEPASSVPRPRPPSPDSRPLDDDSGMGRQSPPGPTQSFSDSGMSSGMSTPQRYSLQSDPGSSQFSEDELSLSGFPPENQPIGPDEPPLFFSNLLTNARRLVRTPSDIWNRWTGTDELERTRAQTMHRDERVRAEQLRELPFPPTPTALLPPADIERKLAEQKAPKTAKAPAPSAPKAPAPKGGKRKPRNKRK
jgi:hypothetical protein